MPDLTDSEKAILQVVVTLSDPSEREDYIRKACGSNLPMLRQLQRLLAADDVAEGFFNLPLDGKGDFFSELPSERIGKYKLLHKIGEGGFGVVYMAEQQEPVVLKVALKVIKLGMDTRQVIARFEAERQALSMMDHPHIAKVLDAGATETGRPYFAMELVRGTSIMEYCDKEQLTNPQRMSLFLDICGAVQHAHQKGIVHRDLKPSNILITLHDGRPVPKVIDFGIAKAIQGRLTEKTLFTRLDQFIGTPAYMSPEQAELSGLDVDTRSDIYSMGVLLCELLTGQIPFHAKGTHDSGYDAIRRRIREQEPPTPSTLLNSLEQDVLTKIALNRHSDPANLPSLLKGDLDWIVMKAMEKDRTHRYETAGAFAEDIQRYLRHEPVLAVPPSKVYRLQKFIRRNQVAISVFATIGAILVLATTISVWQATRAVKAEREQSRLLGAMRTAAERAEAGELRARQVAYASDMVGADYALKLNNLGHARRLLDRNRPKSGETDLRNWEWRAIWHRCRSNAISTLSDSGNQICSVNVSPNGKWLATGQSGGEIRVWDIGSEKTVAILSPLSSQIPSELLRSQVAFTPEGDRLFATAGDNTVRVWETSTWNEMDLNFLHGARIRSICLSHDGTLLAISGIDEKISLWDVDKQRVIRRISSGQSGDSDTRPLAISNNNQWLAIGLSDGKIRMVDLSTLQEQFRFPAVVEGERVQSLAFSPDGKILAGATGLSNTTIELWSVHDRTLIERLKGHTNYVHSLSFSSDGKQLASASADQTIRVWKTGTWNNPTVLRGHQQEVWALDYTPSNHTLVSGSKDGEICIWDSEHQAKASWPLSLPNQLLHLYRSIGLQGRASFSPDGQWLATQNNDGMVSIRTAYDLKEAYQLADLGKNNTGVLFSPQENLLVVGDDTGGLTWIDPVQQQGRKRQKLSSTAKVFPVNFSEDGSRLLALSSNKEEILCFICPRKEKDELISWSIPFSAECAALSPNGSLVVTGHSDGTIRFWDVANPREPTVVSHRRYVTGIAFSPDGKLLASATRFGEARIWDVATRSVLGNINGHVTGIHAIQFSPDGKRLATAGSAGESVKLWDSATLQEVATLNAPGFTFGKIEFSPDGNAILVASFHDSLALWRVPSWEEILATEE